MSKNDITGDRLVTKPQTDSYRENYDKIFGQKEKKCVATGEDTCDDKCEACIEEKEVKEFKKYLDSFDGSYNEMLEKELEHKEYLEER